MSVKNSKDTIWDLFIYLFIFIIIIFFLYSDPLLVKISFLHLPVYTVKAIIC